MRSTSLRLRAIAGALSSTNKTSHPLRHELTQPGHLKQANRISTATVIMGKLNCVVFVLKLYTSFLLSAYYELARPPTLRQFCFNNDSKGCNLFSFGYLTLALKSLVSPTVLLVGLLENRKACIGPRFFSVYPVRKEFILRGLKIGSTMLTSSLFLYSTLPFQIVVVRPRRQRKRDSYCP